MLPSALPPSSPLHGPCSPRSAQLWGFARPGRLGCLHQGSLLLTGNDRQKKKAVSPVFLTLCAPCPPNIESSDISLRVGVSC